jgi:hypothetical protein
MAYAEESEHPGTVFRLTGAIVAGSTEALASDPAAGSAAESELASPQYKTETTAPNPIRSIAATSEHIQRLTKPAPEGSDTQNYVPREQPMTSQVSDPDH